MRAEEINDETSTQPFRTNPMDGCMGYLADHPNIMGLYNPVVCIDIPKDPWLPGIFSYMNG